MKSFISQTIHQIVQKHNFFEDVVLILPSQRAKVFVKQALLHEIEQGFLPEILNIEEFVSGVSEIQKADAIELLFYFYNIYQKETSNPDSFDVFTSWAITVIQDFNEIDQHLVDTNAIFVYIRDIQRLRKWSVKGTFQETDLIKDHHKFLEKLNTYYHLFYSFLVKEGIGYQGVLYREAVKKLSSFLISKQHKTFYFIGFNALNAAEEQIFQQMLLEGNTQVFWDIDTLFLESSHQAGSFIRKYMSNWKYYQQYGFDNSSNWFASTKQIEVIGVSKNVTQIKQAGAILSNFTDFEKTALVLADESLLPITLNSLPKTLTTVNITMGYPLKDIPMTHLVFSIFQLFLSQKKLQKQITNLFYFKDVLRFVKHPAVSKFLNTFKLDFTSKFTNQVTFQNKMFLSLDFIMSFFDINKNESIHVFLNIFKPFDTIDTFLVRCKALITALQFDANTLENEFLQRYVLIFNQLQNLQERFGFITDLKTLFFFFKQFVSSENLSFQGNPLKGLQLMGMLETRVLDFEKLIITSVNEGVLPGNTNQSSFIPFDVKVDFGLPTYREKDAIFSYHFFRLLQRAKQVYILYNTQTDAFGKGEKSRFVKQLELLRDDVILKFVSPKIHPEQTTDRIVEKTDDVLIKLKTLAHKGISPSAITVYLNNPLQFYQQKVLDLKEINSVEETVAMNTLGNVVHDTLEALYLPFVGKNVLLQDVQAMKTKVKGLVADFFQKHFKSGDVTTGKNRLIFEVAIRFIDNFLKQEEALLKNKNNQLKIIAVEQKLSANIELDQFDFPIKLHGNVDRIDELNGTIRIIDYKTGMVTASDLRVAYFEELNDYKYHKAIQVLIYSFLFLSQESYAHINQIEAGVISFRNLRAGFLPLNFAASRGKDHVVNHDRIVDFLEQLKGLLSEVFSKNIPFIEPQESAF